jgi:hypothetical protein
MVTTAAPLGALLASARSEQEVLQPGVFRRTSADNSIRAELQLGGAHAAVVWHGQALLQSVAGL